MDTTRRIGELEVSVAGLGCNNFGWRLDQEQTSAVVEAALDAGVTCFDTADVYGTDGTSEQYLGRALGRRRDAVVVASKFGMGKDAGASSAWITTAVEASLRRLGTDRLDLYWLHQPDPATPIGETLVALDRLTSEGKVREIACSNFSTPQLQEAMTAAADLGVRPFVALQNDYSLLQRAPERDELPACARLGLAFVPYFPLARGLLTGKYRREFPAKSLLGTMAPESSQRIATDERLELVERLAAYAEEHGHTLTELALSWLAGEDLVASVIAGATTPEQVRANMAATTAWALTPAERAEVDALARS